MMFINDDDIQFGNEPIVYYKDKPILTYPNTFSKTLLDLSKKLENMDEKDLDENYIKNILLSNISNELTYPKNNLDNVSEKIKPDGKVTEGIDLRDTYPGKRNVKVTGGESARLVAYKSLGISRDVTQFLPHSGFYIRVGVIPNSELTKLDYMLKEERIRLTRDTAGMALSNDNVMFENIIVDFILEHVKSHNLDIDEEDDLKTYIRTPDIPIIFNILNINKYPKGYEVFLNCKNGLDNEIKCGNKVILKVNPEELLNFNTEAFTDFQKELMFKKKSKSVTSDELKRYRSEMKSTNDKEFIEIINDEEVKFVLQTPFIDEQFDSGEMWVNEIMEEIDEIMMDGNNNEEVKMELYRKLVNNSQMLTYVHYFKEITIGEEVFDTYTKKKELLLALSEDVDLAFRILKQVIDYINNSVISIVGTREFVCSNCEEKYGSTERKIVPIDMLTNFLYLRTIS